jgi:hypothetical protein
VSGVGPTELSVPAARHRFFRLAAAHGVEAATAVQEPDPGGTRPVRTPTFPTRCPQPINSSLPGCYARARRGREQWLQGIGSCGLPGAHGSTGLV